MKLHSPSVESLVVIKEAMRHSFSLCLSLPSFFLGLRRSSLTEPGRAQLEAPPPSPPAPLAPPPELPTLCDFSGTVVRDGSRFALREPDGTLFALDSTGRAWAFEGDFVTINGYFNSQSRLLHICEIDAVEDHYPETV